MNKCDRCNRGYKPLMNLCNVYPDLMVCRDCDIAYFSYQMEFINEVRKNKEIREGKYLTNENLTDYKDK